MTTARRRTGESRRQVFRDRREAGTVLASLLSTYRGRDDVVVLTAGLCVVYRCLNGRVQIGSHPLAVVGRFKCANGKTKQLSARADLLNFPNAHSGIEAQRPNSGLFALKRIPLRSGVAAQNVANVAEHGSRLSETLVTQLSCRR